MRSNVERIIVPYQRAPSRWPNSYASAVDDKLVPRVGREMDERSSRSRGQSKLAAECDDTCGSVLLGRVDPVGNPDPIGLELVNDL